MSITINNFLRQVLRGNDFFSHVVAVSANQSISQSTVVMNQDTDMKYLDTNVVLQMKLLYSRMEIILEKI